MTTNVQNKRTISRLSSALLFLGGIALLAVIVLPIWRIELIAPQYPEGLEMYIYSNKLGGEVEIINGLNHYIGMKELHEDDFIEFTILPYLIAFYALLFMLVAWSRRRKHLNILFGLFILFGVVAMVDFYMWLHDYGHNLDPNAAIQVPGMTYQPPLIGYKQLLNFLAFSIPDSGGWIFIGCGLLLAFLVFREWKIGKQTLVAASLLLFFSCSQDGPQAIRYGQDQCIYCKMTISDARFGTQIVTKKGRAFNFDDIQCMIAFLKAGDVDQSDIQEIYVPDYVNDNQLLPVSEVLLLKSESLRSPMRGDIAAFRSKEDLEDARKIHGGEVLTWDDLL